jgi:glycerol-3-phosphate acyltransferase PlsX
MKIALDIMGGDFAPLQTTLGAIQASEELGNDVKLVLIGDEKEIRSILDQNGSNSENFEIVHTTEVIGMSEHPTKAISKKTDSSIAVGFGLLKAGKVDAFASAGNTGAMFVGAAFSVRPIEGVTRPAIAALVPKEKGGYGVILDVGANADCKPEHLVQFGILGSLFAKSVFGIDNPKVGLMNLGEEEEKGSILTQAANQLLKNTPQINFAGNIEGRDLFNDKADVIVCDGFTGNVILKEAESFYYYIRKRGIQDEFFDRFNYENYGGSPILGVNAPVVIGHGISNAKAIKNMILMTRDMVTSNLTNKITKIFKEAVV